MQCGYHTGSFRALFDRLPNIRAKHGEGYPFLMSSLSLYLAQEVNPLYTVLTTDVHQKFHPFSPCFDA